MQWLCVETDEDEEDCADITARSLEPSSLATRRVEETVKLFELNDDDWHRQRRIRFIDKLTELHRQGELRKLSRHAIRYRPHSLAARSFLEAYAPELLPDATSELRWLIRTLCKDLRGILDLYAQRGRASGTALGDAREKILARDAEQARDEEVSDHRAAPPRSRRRRIAC